MAIFAGFVLDRPLSQLYRTPNFIVTAPTPRPWKSGKTAEHYREFLPEWLAKEIAPLVRASTLSVKMDRLEQGRDNFAFDRGEKSLLANERARHAVRT